MHKNLRHGFTLVEISIVLIIIGAIIGGVLVGKSILTNSRLQTVMTDADSYTTSAVNFKQTYQMLPGDFNNAQAVWGVDSNCTGTFYTLTGLGAGGGGSGTCNGDGNGEIYSWSSAEQALFWQHLALAGMYSGSSTDCVANQASSSPSCYNTSGNATFLASNSVIGYNVPAGSIRGSGWSIGWLGNVASGDADNYQSSTDTTQTITGAYGNALFFGASDVYAAGIGGVDYSNTRDPIISPDQAAMIDQKMDDGMPASGKVRAFMPGSLLAPNCAIASNSSTPANLATTSAYNVNASGPLCTLLFVMGL